MIDGYVDMYDLGPDSPRVFRHPSVAPGNAIGLSAEHTPDGLIRVVLSEDASDAEFQAAVEAIKESDDLLDRMASNIMSVALENREADEDEELTGSGVIAELEAEMREVYPSWAAEKDVEIDEHYEGFITDSEEEMKKVYPSWQSEEEQN